MVDESGNIVNSYKYDEWGNLLFKDEQVYNPIRYAGEYFDEESGLYYLRARYYDPTIGRFISKDSYEGDITNPLSLNLYTYVENNPLIYIDPSGHELTDADKEYLNWFQRLKIIEYSSNYKFAQTLYDIFPSDDLLAEMNYWRAEAVKLRQDNYDYEDNYDYTHGGIHTGEKKQYLPSPTDVVGATTGLSNVGQKAPVLAKQIHHFLTNKSQKFTPMFQKIVLKYGLKLDESWNKGIMPHLGRHPNEYHNYMLNSLKKIDKVAKGSKEIFMKLFDKLKQEIINSPEMLNKRFWE
jgi:RHS repeat-associated protein